MCFRNLAWQCLHMSSHDWPVTETVMKFLAGQYRVIPVFLSFAVLPSALFKSIHPHDDRGIAKQHFSVPKGNYIILLRIVLSMKLPEQLEKIKDMKHAKWIGLGVTILFNIILMTIALFLMDPFAGYYVLMVGLVAISFATLYIFGWRDGKQLAIAGIGIFILMGAIWGPMKVHYDYGLPEPGPTGTFSHIDWFTKNITPLDTGSYEANGIVYVEDAGIYNLGNMVYVLDNGTLDPYQGAVGDAYEFRITLYSNDTFTTPPEMMLAYASASYGDISTPFMEEVDPTDTNYVDGKEFHYIATIDKAGIYSHTFSVNFQGDHRNSVNTTVELGPLVGDETNSYGVYALIGIPSMFCNIGMLFIILVLLYWWIGTAKEKRKSWDMALLEKENELEEETAIDDTKSDTLDTDDDKPFTCDQCGASVSADDNFCPKCGERFDGVEGDSDETAARENEPEKEADEEISSNLDSKEPEE